MMNNEVQVAISNFGIKADDMTHGLKVRGNGSMLEGIRNIYIDAWRKGEKTGVKKGVIYGIAGTVTVALLYKGGELLYRKIELLNRGKSKDNILQNVKTEEIVKKIQQDKEFSWTKVKWGMHLKDYIDIVDFENWILPLECKVFNNRIFLEYPSESKEDILYLKENYKQLIEKYIWEAMGKKYIVTFVRPEEIIIEDEIYN